MSGLRSGGRISVVLALAFLTVGLAINASMGSDGEMREVPSGGRVGLRPQSESGDPAVDVNIPEVPEVTKIHFPN